MNRATTPASGILGLILFGGSLCAAHAQTAGESQPLEPGKSVERSIAKGEIHRYRIQPARGEYVRVAVEPKGVGLAVRLIAPDGASLIEVEDPNAETEPLPVLLVAEADGTYSLEVRTSESSPGSGNYAIRIAELRAASAEDTKRVAAAKLEAEGDRLRRQRKGDALRQAVERYRAALELWQAGADRQREAGALGKLGPSYNSLGDYAKALDSYRRELALWKELGDRRREARALQNAGQQYVVTGQPQKGLEFLDGALEIQREIGDRRAEAITLNSLAYYYFSTGQGQKALESLQQALPLRRQVGDRSGEAYTLHSIGTTYLSMAEQQKALEYLQQALALWPALRNPSGEATTLNSIAMAYSALGEQQKAFEYLNRALPLWRAAGNRGSEASALNNLAHIYTLLGEPRKALEYYGGALEIFRAVHERNGEAIALANMGRVHRELGDLPKTLELFHQALAIQRETGNRGQQGITLTGLGGAYTDLRQLDKALDSYNQALPLLRAAESRMYEGIALTGLGRAYSLGGQQDQAFESLSQAQALLDSIGARNPEVTALYLLARVERERGRLDQALDRIRAALDLAESLRENVAGEELRSSYFATARESFELEIDVLMRLHRERPRAGYDARALEASERARARSLLDLLAESHADLRQGVEPQLLEREQSLRRLLSAKAERQVRMLSGKHTEAQAGAAEKEIRALAVEYEQAEAEIRARSPHYAALTQPQPLSLSQIQRQVLDANTVLLEYSLGEERSFLWEVTPGSLRVHELPNRDVMETAARKAYAQLSASGVPRDGSLGALSQMLLGPVAARLGNKRLVVVAEGAVQYIPFASLPPPSSASALALQAPSGPAQGRTVLERHEIVSLPSASTLALLRRELAGRKPAPLALAVLADPVFHANDPRVRGATESSPSDASPLAALERSAGESGLLSLDRLRATRREAEQIAALAGPNTTLRAVDFQASRSTATSRAMGRYRILHFATHALLNSQHPELSGLVLSLVDERGRTQNGFLQAHEIYNLQFGADLAVLSACQTALGKDVRGEGMIGLTRGFMYAGVPRVVASLWKVPDQATADLMKRFYEGMLARKLSPAAALRAAQLSLSREPDYAAPYYWAAFSLQGEWR